MAVGLVLFCGIHESHAAKKIDLLANGMQLSDQWVITDGVLSPSEDPGGIIWSKDIFDDFEISVEYKTSPKCNSGLFFRADPKNPVQGGFEVQIASPGLYSENMLRALSMTPKSQLFMPVSLTASGTNLSFDVTGHIFMQF